MCEPFKTTKAGTPETSDDWHAEKQRAMRRARLERSKAAHDLIQAVLRRRRNRVRPAAKIDHMRRGWGA